MCKCRCNGEECSFSISSRAQTRFALMNGGQFRRRHLYLKISTRGGGKNHNTWMYIPGFTRSINSFLLEAPIFPLLLHWHGAWVEVAFSCYLYENENLNLFFLITFLMGTECRLIMERSVVTVSDSGVRWESNTHFGRLARCQQRGRKG